MFRSTIIGLILSLGFMTHARCEGVGGQASDLIESQAQSKSDSKSSKKAKIKETMGELGDAAIYGGSATGAALAALLTGAFTKGSGSVAVFAPTTPVVFAALAAILSYKTLSKLDDALLDGKTKKFVVNGARKAFKKIKGSSRGQSNRNIAKTNAQ